MNAIMVEISWSSNKGKGHFREMTEIAACQLQSVDGIVVEGGTFHSFIRPVFQKWKKSRVSHPNYSDWWLAPTYSDVMVKFDEWYGSVGNVPWIVWNRYLFSVWEENRNKFQNYSVLPTQVISMEKELKGRNIPYKKSEQLQAKNKLKHLTNLLFTLPLEELKPEEFHLPKKEDEHYKQNGSIKNLSGLLEQNTITLSDIKEWSHLSEKHLVDIFFRKQKVNSFQLQRLQEAWTMWQTLQELQESWKDR
ncbi:hypothetical protein ACERII_09305 [Evansella sp. AB-rgal1]|uniref:hypothetical protein n=1 Tax=Evansella sp. AB-rgal1 TaxID=3242696 RepID=UPI00359D06B5